MLGILPQKRCTCCKQTLNNTAEFWHKNKSRKDGLSDVCKECAKSRAKRWAQDNPEQAKETKQAYYQANQEQIKANVRERYWADPEKARAEKADYYQRNKEECNARNREWALGHPERIKQIKDAYVQRHPDRRLKSSRNWHENNREYERQLGRDWRKNNPEKSRAYAHKRRALERAAEGGFTPEDLRIAYRSQRGRCWHCGHKVDFFHADHLIPLKHGGTNWPNNIVIACRDCNLKKGSKLCYRWNGRLF